MTISKKNTIKRYLLKIPKYQTMMKYIRYNSLQEDYMQHVYETCEAWCNNDHSPATFHIDKVECLGNVGKEQKSMYEIKLTGRLDLKETEETTDE